MELLAMPTALYFQVAPVLYGWKARGNMVLTTDALTPTALVKAVNTVPFTSLLLMDTLPTIVYPESVDGHDAWEVPHDPQIAPGKPVGRLDFSRLSGVDAVAAYAGYFRRLDDWYAYGQKVPSMVQTFNGFGDYASIGPNTASALAGIDPGLIADLSFAIAGTPPDGPGPEFYSSPCLLKIIAEGGQDPSWLWQGGHTADFTSRSLNTPFVSIFGSRMVNSQVPNSLLRGALSFALASVYDYYGRFAWGDFLRGATLGQCQLKAGFGFSSIMGSPSLRLEQGMVDAIAAFPQVMQAVSALSARVTKLEGAVPVITLPDVTVMLALYRSINYPSTMVKDVTADVQKLVDTGVTWHVWPGLTDPFVGEPKELYVRYSLNGTVQPAKTFSQYAEVLLK